MINLKLTKSDKKKMEKQYSIGPEDNNYPYGTKIRFENETIQKSKKLQNLKSGDMVNISAVGKVLDVRTVDRDQSKEYECIEIQIQKIECNSGSEAEDAFNEE